MTEAYVVNVSSIQDFMKCRWRWVAKWVENRVPKDEARPLRFGKLLHEVYEEHFLTHRPMSVVIEKQRAKWVDTWEACTDPLVKQVAWDAIEDLDRYTEPLSMWQDRYPAEGEPLEVERAFLVKSPLDPTILFKGRPDRMQMLWGQLFHWQNRSLAAGVNFPIYVELAKRSMHEHMYAFYARQAYPKIPYGGTIYNLLRKLKYRGVPTKKDPQGKILHSMEEMCWQGMVSISPEMNDHMMEIMSRTAAEMRFTEMLYREDGIWPLPNETIHGGAFGNSIDPYFRVLNGELSLTNDTVFKNREDPYAASPVG